MEGQWSVVQNSWEVGQDVWLRANGMIASVVDADGADRELVANPVLRELGYTDESLIEPKIAGAIT
jgi:hypothetical protein